MLYFLYFFQGLLKAAIILSIQQHSGYKITYNRRKTQIFKSLCLFLKKAYTKSHT